MKRLLALALCLAMVFALAACSKQEAKTPETNETNETGETTETGEANENTETGEVVQPGDETLAEDGGEESIDDDTPAAPAAPAEGVLSYADYMAAPVDQAVTVDVYVQAHQSWWDNTVTVYAQDKDGGYFIYGMECSEEDAAKLVPGTAIRVSGFKSEWSGEVEIVDATFEFIDGSFVAEPTDVTDKLGTDELVNYQNMLVSFKDMTVEDYGDGNAFAYKNAEEKTDDLYFKVSKDGKTYDFCVEYYLCDENSDVYKAVENLKIGDTVDLEGFLYWYEGANPHITSVTVK